MTYVLTLVHGNWPNRNGWIAEGSFLRRALAIRLKPDSTIRLKPDSTIFREFWWAGTNMHAARIDAGARLARFLRDGHAQYPDARHVVVAHSHGGNVALYAMRDPAARAIVDGIVTIGTPFIRTRRREPERYADVIAWLMLAVAVFVPFIVLDAVGLSRAMLAWFITSVVVMVTMRPAVKRWVIRTAAREQENIVAAVQPPDVEPSKLAIVCARGDEAMQWLRVWDILTESPFAIGCVLFSLVSAASRVNLPILTDRLMRLTIDRGLDGISLFGFDGWALAAGMLVLCVVWAAVLMCSGIIGWPGYWREPLLANLLVEIGTNGLPGKDGNDGFPEKDGWPGYMRTFDVRARWSWNRIKRGDLRHSAICDEPAVVLAIGDWIVHGPAR